ncbi:MAG: hypothetical protein ILP09_06485 [Oscillospiraceae bacterium]|nr:hypothetical protein [Oscillospiraceae bacterium]
MKLKLFGKKREDREAAILQASAADVKKTAGRQLIVSSCLTFMSVLVLVAASVAWFASNRTTDSNGMQMQIETSPNLIIAQDAAAISAMTASDASFSTTFSTAARTLNPATHNWGNYPTPNGNGGPSSTGLIYNRNPSAVDTDTGEARTGSTLYYNDALNDSQNGKYYYTDYTVYIASVSKPLPATGLIATLSSPNAALNSYDYHNAASVDFYLGSVSQSNYKGTLNLAGKGFTDSSSGLASLDLTGSTTIPLNTAASDNYITVIMRFYFDGALEKGPGQAYVYSNGLTTADFSMTVTFTAAEE